jgi:broad specificity phosphatase PhoE
MAGRADDVKYTGRHVAGYRRQMRERRFTFVRHASTIYNDRRLLNGDAQIPVPLDAAGRVAAVALAASLARRPFDLALHTRFARTRETLSILLAHRRGVPVAVESSFDDIRVGMFEGRDIETYRAWRALHPPSERVPGGESRLDALGRYADGCARLLGRHDARCVLLVVHDVPMRFLRNALLRADPLDGPVRTIANLEVLRVSEAQLGAALAVMRRRVAGLPPV